FLAWLLTLAYASLRPTRCAWVELLSLAGVLFGAVPLLNALSTDRHLVAALGAGDWLMAGFDSTALVCGALFAWAAWLVAHKQPLDVPTATRETAARLTKAAAATAELAE